jgi:hypothetical protein
VRVKEGDDRCCGVAGTSEHSAVQLQNTTDSIRLVRWPFRAKFRSVFRCRIFWLVRRAASVCGNNFATLSRRFCISYFVHWMTRFFALMTNNPLTITYGTIHVLDLIAEPPPPLHPSVPLLMRVNLAPAGRCIGTPTSYHIYPRHISLLFPLKPLPGEQCCRSGLNVFGPPRSGSISTRYGSGSFCYQAKIVRKTLISCFVTSF